MSVEQELLIAAGLVAGVVALLLAVRAQRRATRAEGVAGALSARLALLEQRAPAASGPARADGHDERVDHYLITTVDKSGDESAPTPVRVPVTSPVDGRLFTDLVVRETVVRAASWTHGVRRALSAESRHRIRFEVRQETRRAARGRRAELKQALREFRARKRSAVRGDGPGSVGEDVA